MSLWSRFFGKSFEDDKLTATLQNALAEDPLISDPMAVKVASKDGVITLSGKVDKTLAKDHIEGATRDALRYNGLKYQTIVNDIKVESAVPVA